VTAPRWAKLSVACSPPAFSSRGFAGRCRISSAELPCSPKQAGAAQRRPCAPLHLKATRSVRLVSWSEFWHRSLPLLWLSAYDLCSVEFILRHALRHLCAGSTTYLYTFCWFFTASAWFATAWRATFTCPCCPCTHCYLCCAFSVPLACLVSSACSFCCLVSRPVLSMGGRVPSLHARVSMCLQQSPFNKRGRPVCASMLHRAATMKTLNVVPCDLNGGSAAAAACAGDAAAGSRRARLRLASAGAAAGFARAACCSMPARHACAGACLMGCCGRWRASPHSDSTSGVHRQLFQTAGKTA